LPGLGSPPKRLATFASLTRHQLEGRKKERNVTSKKNQLTDTAYAQWMEEEEWSLTQAVYLLHGFVPPATEIAIDQLIKEFPDAEGLLQHYPNLLKKKDKKKECPDTWVFLAATLYDMDVPICWDAIFPQWIKGNGGYHFGKSPDYRCFVQVYVSDTATPLGELAEYVLNLGEKAMINPPAEFYDILKYMNTALEMNAKEISELPGRFVSPRKFIAKCPGRYFNSNNQCRRWVNWPSKHPKLAAKLEASGKAKKSAKTKKATGDPLEKTYQIFVKSYVSDINNGLDRKKLPGFNKKYNVLKEHVLNSVSMTIGERWPNADSLRTSISRKYSSPKKHKDVRKAKASVNPFNQ